jgi:hypothetical protein
MVWFKNEILLIKGDISTTTTTIAKKRKQVVTVKTNPPNFFTQQQVASLVLQCALVDKYLIDTNAALATQIVLITS